MPTILCIETSTRNCSVAIGVEGRVAAERNDQSHQHSHAEKLHVFIEETFIEAGLSFSDLDAVAVSQGPGSYTGLRIGVSAAKGIAYAMGIPLIAVDTLAAMASAFFEPGNRQLLIPMIDARRMEVFCAGYDGGGSEVFATRAEILDDLSFPEADEFDAVKFFGDGAAKCIETFSERETFEFVPDVVANAASMVQLADQLYTAKQFEDVAYFEPFYLKDFVAGKPKKNTQ